MSGSSFRADLNSRNMERTTEENAHPRRGRHDDSRRRNRGKPLARAPRRRLSPPPCRHARRGAGRHPRLRRQSRREKSGGSREPANLHRLPTDASDYSPRLRRGARAAPADGRDRARPAGSRLSVSDGEANGDQRGSGGGGSCQSSPARCVCRRPASPALHALRHARPRAARCGALWPAVAHLRPAQPAGTGALPNLGLRLMLDPAEAGGGCLRNLGPHGFDMFLHLTGEETQVTGAQLSRRAHERSVEDYASVMLRSASGVLGTVEVGNGFPRDGTDGEWKIAGRDAILTMKDGIMKLATAEGDETLAGSNVTAPYFTVLRDALDHWQRGAAPPISVHDCARAVRLIDEAYERAG